MSDSVQQDEWISETRASRDIALIRRAVKEGWMPPRTVKSRILGAIVEYVDQHAEEATRSPEQIEIFRRIAEVLIRMDASDTAAHRLALDAEQGQQPGQIVVRIVQEETF